VFIEPSVTIRALRENLAEHLRRVEAGGSLLVTSRGRPVARLVPPTPLQAAPRPFGFMKGRIRMAPDFDATPTDLEASIEGPLEAPIASPRHR
jgi:prevent-host-death family protein